MEERQDHATRTISIVMIIALVGKVLGLYRDHLLAVYYGTGMAANAFNTASRIPRVFFDAVFASAISACFIPVFSEYLTRKGREPAFRFAGCFITVMGLLSAVLSVLGILFAGPLVSLFADGYDAQTAELAVSLTRVMFPTVLFTGVAFSFVGVLQSLGEFNVPALISVVSNLVIILYYLTLDQQFGIYGLAVAFLVGWFLQAAVQVPSLRRPGLDLRSEGMRKVFALMLPVMVSTWVQPINLTINSKFGSRLYEGAGVSAIEFSTNLYLVIAGVFVLSVTNVIFPKLSRLTGREQEGEFRETLRTTLHGCLFFVLPMSAGLMVLSRPLISFIYGGGAFDDFSVSITSQGLFWVSLGMTGYAVQNILSRAYFARQKGKVPLAAGAASILVNVLHGAGPEDGGGWSGPLLRCILHRLRPVAGHPPGAAGGGGPQPEFPAGPGEDGAGHRADGGGRLGGGRPDRGPAARQGGGAAHPGGFGGGWCGRLLPGGGAAEIGRGAAGPEDGETSVETRLMQ